jgi:hypothetical protein
MVEIISANCGLFGAGRFDRVAWRVSIHAAAVPV